jgi:hypothetical protein
MAVAKLMMPGPVTVMSRFTATRACCKDGFRLMRMCSEADLMDVCRSFIYAGYTFNTPGITITNILLITSNI